MVELSDDELGVIFRSIADPMDRTSISLVSKQWLRVEGLTRSSVRALSPDLLSAFLPRFPNLTAFDSPAPIDDSQALCLASFCPKIETLILDFDDEGAEDDAVSASDDITDVGLYAIAKWCRNLSSLSVRNRRKIGDIGVFSLVRFSCNLNSLDLSGCTSLTDQALLAVGLMGSIESLSLEGCSLITDKGLAMLSFEPLSKNLKKLVLSGCDRITDLGVVSLSKMSALEELSLADCGHGITELGGLSISRIRSLKRLDLARLNLADLTLILVAEGCGSLIEVVIDGCRNISGQGVSAFGAHKSLEVFSMAACDGVSLDCVKQLSECRFVVGRTRFPGSGRRVKDMGHTHTGDFEQPPSHAAPPVQPPPMRPHMPMGGALGPLYPPQEQLLTLTYCIHSNPSWPQLCILAFQHYIVMLGTAVLIANTIVPSMGGTNGDKARVIQLLLFMAGINTLLQTWLGTRLPTVMGPSYAFIIPVTSIISDYNQKTFSSEHQRFTYTIRTIQGSLIVSSFIGIILGYGKVWAGLTRFISPVVVVPLVSVVGLGLFTRGFSQLANCVEIGLPMLILLILTQQHARRFVHGHGYHSVLERYALLLCVGIIWAFAAILTVAGAYNHVRAVTKMSCRTDRSYLISSAPWVKVPYPFQWGAPIFRAGDVFAMMGAALVTSAESTATFYAASRLAGATPPPAHVLSRSIGLQGVSLLLDGLFGAAVGTTASVENVGLLGLTRVGSRRVVQLSTAFMIFFSIFGKFGALFASIPLPIFAAIYCVLWGIVAATGISFIQFLNKNSLRNLYVLGLTLFLGISIPYYFWSYTTSTNQGPVKTNGGWFNDILNTIFSSPATVALIVGTLLDTTLEAREAYNDRGVPWWVPFQDRDGEPRNDEFYSFPLNLDEYLPSRFRK